MTRYGAVLDFCGPFPDGDGIYDLTARVSKDARVLRAAYAALGSQVPHQLFLSCGLDKLILAELHSKRLLNCADQFAAIFAKQPKPFNFVTFEEHLPNYRLEWPNFSHAW